MENGMTIAELKAEIEALKTEKAELKSAIAKLEMLNNWYLEQ